MPEKLTIFFEFVDIVYFFIAFILYTFLDIAWVQFIIGVEKTNPKLAAVSSTLITLIVFMAGWVVYVQKSFWGLLGACVGSFFGAYIACMKFKK